MLKLGYSGVKDHLLARMQQLVRQEKTPCKSKTHPSQNRASSIGKIIKIIRIIKTRLTDNGEIDEDITASWSPKDCSSCCGR